MAGGKNKGGKAGMSKKAIERAIARKLKHRNNKALKAECKKKKK